MRVSRDRSMAITKALNQDSKQYYHLGLEDIGTNDEDEDDDDYEYEAPANDTAAGALAPNGSDVPKNQQQQGQSLAEELSLAARKGGGKGKSGKPTTGSFAHPCLQQDHQHQQEHKQQAPETGIYVNRLHDAFLTRIPSPKRSEEVVITAAPSSGCATADMVVRSHGGGEEGEWVRKGREHQRQQEQEEKTGNGGQRRLVVHRVARAAAAAAASDQDLILPSCGGANCCAVS